MLDYAQKKLQDLKGITCRQADIADLPFPDGSFNVAACQFGLMFVPDKDRAFREMRRVLVAGGLLAFSVWDRMENNPMGHHCARDRWTIFPGQSATVFQSTLWIL